MKKALSLFLAVLMVLSVLPVSIFMVVGETVPEGAVAYVTDKDGNPVDAGTEGPDGENDLGEGYYKTLEAAFEVCPENVACKILVEKDYMQDVNILKVSAKQDITLDLNGKKIYSVMEQPGNSSLLVNTGKLTVMDNKDTNKDGSAGYLTTEAENPDLQEIPAAGNYCVINNGTLVVESGKIGSTTTKGGATFALHVTSGSHTTINGGLLTSASGSTVRIWDSGKSKIYFDINGGAICGWGGIWIQIPEAYKSDATNGTGAPLELNVNGGKVIATATKGSAIYDYSFGWEFNDDYHINIYDAEISAPNCAVSTASKKAGAVKIYGGKFSNGWIFNTRYYDDESIKTHFGASEAGNIQIYSGLFNTSFYNTSAGEIVITGGYFDRDITAYLGKAKDGSDLYCITTDDTTYDGYKAGEHYKNSEIDVSGYTHKVGDPAEGTFEAVVISADGKTKTKYTTVDGAIKVVKTDETVQLLKNASASAVSYLGYGSGFGPSATNFTVDLNGYTLDVDAGYVFYTYSNDFSGLTFKNGQLNLNADYALYTCYHTDDFTLTLDNVDITAPETVYYPIYCYNGTVINAVDDSKNSISVPASSGIGIYASGTIDLVGTGELEIDADYGIYTKNYTATPAIGLTITNPNLTVNSDDGYAIYSFYSQSGTYYTSGGFDIEGGTYNGECYFYKPYGSSEITGGTFNDNVTIKNNWATVEFDGGVFLGGDDEVSAVNISGNGGNVYVYDGTFNSFYAEAIADTASVDIYDGTFKGYVTLYDLSAWYNGAYPTSGYGEAEGTNLSITGGKFGGSLYKDTTHAADDVMAVYYNADGKIEDYAKCISGGIFTSDTYEDDENLFDNSLWTMSIANGYTKAANDDTATKSAYPFTVKPLEVTVNEESVASATKTDIEGNDLEEAAKTVADKAIGEMLDNKAVGLFVETNIDDATKEKTVVSDDGFNISMVLEALKEAAKDPTKNLALGTKAEDTAAAATDEGQITVSEENFKDQDIDKKINVDLEAARIEVFVDESEPNKITKTTVNGATFDVKPTATIRTYENGVLTGTVTAIIPNEAITNPISFRIPVDPQLGGNLKAASVWHSDDKENFKKDYLGILPIQEENGEYFIELSAEKFSYYTYENMMNVSETNVVAIVDKDGKYTGFDTLTAALAAFDETKDATIIILDDITAGENGENTVFDFDGKTMNLDLNGYTFTAAPADGTGVVKATGVTVIDSDPDTTKTGIAATGVYANDVSALIADGFVAKTNREEATPAVGATVENNEVFLKALKCNVKGKTGLVYKTDKAQSLIESCSVKANGRNYAPATIEYAVLTAKDAASGKKPADKDYSTTLPTAKDANTYVVFYRIKADGFDTVEGNVNVTIAKQKVAIVWTAPEGFEGSGASFSAEYNKAGFAKPTAKFTDADGKTVNIADSDVIWISGPNKDKSLKDIGTYTFEVAAKSNYEFSNAKATVKVYKHDCGNNGHIDEDDDGYCDVCCYELRFHCKRCRWYEENKDCKGIKKLVVEMIHTITHLVQYINWLS